MIEHHDVSAMHSGGLSAGELSAARKFLRDLQAQNPTRGGVIRMALEQSTIDSALEQLSKHRDFQRTDDPHLVVRDGLKFNTELEERRIALAEDLIRRVDPGPFEDPVYLSLLAYQAASIEMALPDHRNGKPIDWWTRFLLGTVHSPETNANAQRFDSHGYIVVVLYSGMIEFAYQAAKAVVAAQNPVRTTDSRWFVSTDSSAEHITAELARNQEPVERLYRTLEAYFFAGYPRVFANEVVPQEHLLPLGFLIDMTERWIIAHEYGHGFAPRIDWKRAPDSPERAEEYFADANATILTAMSAARLDAVPPEFGLIGGLFALACLEVIRRGLSLVCRGVIDADRGDDQHPPNHLRAENILHAFNALIDVHETATGVDVDLKVRPDLNLNPQETDATRLRRARVFQYPNALFAIWDRVLPRLRKDFENGRRLHPMWR